MSLVFKNGHRCELDNYRPITVLPVLCKIMEKIVHTQLYDYLNGNKLITSKQFGFRRKLLTGLASSRFIHSILAGIDGGRFTGAVFLDLTKPFNIVDHTILMISFAYLELMKIPSFGFNPIYQKKAKSLLLAMVCHLYCPYLWVSHREVYLDHCFLLFICATFHHVIYRVTLSCMLTILSIILLYYSSKNVKVLEKKLNANLVVLSKWLHDHFQKIKY